MLNRRAIPAAVGAAILAPAVANAQSPQSQIANLQAQIVDLKARLEAQEQWRASVEAVWPLIVEN